MFDRIRRGWELTKKSWGVLAGALIVAGGVALLLAGNDTAVGPFSVEELESAARTR